MRSSTGLKLRHASVPTPQAFLCSCLDSYIEGVSACFGIIGLMVPKCPQLFFPLFFGCQWRQQTISMIGRNPKP